MPVCLVSTHLGQVGREIVHERPVTGSEGLGLGGLGGELGHLLDARGVEVTALLVALN